MKLSLLLTEIMGSVDPQTLPLSLTCTTTGDSRTLVDSIVVPVR
jgi:hypothetical protein